MIIVVFHDIKTFILKNNLQYNICETIARFNVVFCINNTEMLN